jgi:hypothetical protein
MGFFRFLKGFFDACLGFCQRWSAAYFDPNIQSLHCTYKGQYVEPIGVQFFVFLALLEKCLLDYVKSKNNTKPNCAHLSNPIKGSMLKP